jgi:hypothetical protein
MEDPMTRQQMYDKAEGHNRMSQTREQAPGTDRPGMGGPGGFRPPQRTPEQMAEMRKVQNASRLKALHDIETNMRTLEGMPFIK